MKPVMVTNTPLGLVTIADPPLEGMIKPALLVLELARLGPVEPNVLYRDDSMYFPSNLLQAAAGMGE